MNRYVALSLFLLVLLAGCSEKQTTDPEKCYEYWAYQKPPKDVKPLKAQYWQSANWSKEYIMYIELATSAKWKKEFIKQNHLVSVQNADLPTDAPSWFKLGKSAKLWRHSGDETCVYFEDMCTGHFFIYEQQL